MHWEHSMAAHIDRMQLPSSCRRVQCDRVRQPGARRLATLRGCQPGASQAVPPHYTLLTRAAGTQGALYTTHHLPYTLYTNIL